MIDPHLEERHRELAARVRERIPHLSVLFVSGYTGESAATADGAFLAKPFTPDALTAKVRTLIKGQQPPG